MTKQEAELAVPASPAGESFPEQARRVIGNLQDSLSRIIDSLPGPRILRPSELAHSLKIDSILAWKIFKIVDTKNIFEAAQYIPGRAGLKKFFQAATRTRLPRDLINQAMDISTRFEEMVRLHAGNRKSFDMMIAGYAEKQSDRAGLEHRKGAFLHGSYIWGVQAKAQVHTTVFNVSKTNGFMDAASIRGFIDLRWIRPNVFWRISRLFTVNDAGELRTDFSREPLDPGGIEANGSVLPLLRDFCSHPLPEYRRATDPDGCEYRLAEGTVGNTGVQTCITGEVVHAVEPRFRTAAHRDLVVEARVRTPCESLIFDCLIRRDLAGEVPPRAEMYGRLMSSEFREQIKDYNQLPLHEPVEVLDLGPAAIRTPEVPRYREMLLQVFDRLGWEQEQFRVYRLRVQYPPMPTGIRLTFELPEDPAGETRAQ